MAVVGFPSHLTYLVRVMAENLLTYSTSCTSSSRAVLPFNFLKVSSLTLSLGLLLHVKNKFIHHACILDKRKLIAGQ